MDSPPHFLTPPIYWRYIVIYRRNTMYAAPGEWPGGWIRRMGGRGGSGELRGPGSHGRGGSGELRGPGSHGRGGSGEPHGPGSHARGGSGEPHGPGSHARGGSG